MEIVKYKIMNAWPISGNSSEFNERWESTVDVITNPDGLHGRVTDVKFSSCVLKDEIIFTALIIYESEE